MPHGRFDDPLKILDDGKAVEACGPLRWDDGGPAQSLTIEHVEIRQGSTKGGKGLDAQSQRPAPEWMGGVVPVEGSGKFESGPAQAHADVVVVEDGRTKREPWHQQVQLSTEGDGSD